MLLKIIIFIVLLLTPPYGWVGLFLWLVWHATREDMKKQKEKDKNPSSQPSPSALTAQAEPEPELLTAKVANGRCDLYTLSSGRYVRSLGADVVQACAGRDYVAVVNRRGEVDIYSAASGCYVRRQSSDGVSAQIQGDDIAITDKTGRVAVYNLSNGTFVRYL